MPDNKIPIFNAHHGTVERAELVYQVAVMAIDSDVYVVSAQEHLSVKRPVEDEFVALAHQRGIEVFGVWMRLDSVGESLEEIGGDNVVRVEVRDPFAAGGL